LTEKIILVSNYKKIKFVVEELLEDNNINYNWNSDYELEVSLEDYEKTKDILEKNCIEHE
jgi:hypothetical protein